MRWKIALRIDESANFALLYREEHLRGVTKNVSFGI